MTKRPPLSQEEIRRRLELMRHAIASASIENLQSDERTRGWFLEFAHGRLSEEEGIERIKADL